MVQPIRDPNHTVLQSNKRNSATSGSFLRIVKSNVTFSCRFPHLLSHLPVNSKLQSLNAELQSGKIKLLVYIITKLGKIGAHQTPQHEVKI
jgi:hypothetical protein